jgi:phosphoribosylformylglycinamidine (FGAM) synthase-like enzyme
VSIVWANTGVGGVIRDVIGVSARPIANTDVLCFGPPDLDFADLPAGVLLEGPFAERAAALYQPLLDAQA